MYKARKVDLRLIDLIKTIAIKHGLSYKQVESIFRSQFAFTRHIIETGVRGERDTFKNILHIHLGKFIVKDTKFKLINDKYGKKDRL